MQTTRLRAAHSTSAHDERANARRRGRNVCASAASFVVRQERADARPPLRPAAFFCAVVPPCFELLFERDEPELLPPRLEAPGEFAMRAARDFDIPLSFRASYCFSFLTFARLLGMRPPSEAVVAERTQRRALWVRRVGSYALSVHVLRTSTAGRARPCVAGLRADRI